jgi:hypothetical protein
MTGLFKRPECGAQRLLFFLLLSASVLTGDASGYVLPPEQILEFMAGNAAGYSAVGIIWEHASGDRQPEHGPAREEVWFRSPDDYSIRRAAGPDPGEQEGAGAAFLELFTGRRHRIERFLLELGVDLDSSSYTRVERTVAFRIGGDAEEAPALIIEKSRFIPILLRYASGRGWGGGMTELSFLDYRPSGEGWFPYEVRYRTADGTTGSYRVLDLRPGEPPPAEGYSTEGAGADGAGRESEADRLERVIKSLEEKHENR